jgi:hypothetical protein
VIDEVASCLGGSSDVSGLIIIRQGPLPYICSLCSCRLCHRGGIASTTNAGQTASRPDSRCWTVPLGTLGKWERHLITLLSVGTASSGITLKYKLSAGLSPSIPTYQGTDRRLQTYVVGSRTKADEQKDSAPRTKKPRLRAVSMQSRPGSTGPSS